MPLPWARAHKVVTPKSFRIFWHRMLGAAREPGTTLPMEEPSTSITGIYFLGMSASYITPVAMPIMVNREAKGSTPT